MVIPYITFAGNCRKALEHYQTAFGSVIQMQQPYGDYVPEGVAAPPTGLKDWVLHAEMEICGAKFWFADEVAEPVTQGNMVKLTVTMPDIETARKTFEILSDGARITLPPTETFYSAFHAGLVDKFGIGWNIVVENSDGQ